MARVAQGSSFQLEGRDPPKGPHDNSGNIIRIAQGNKYSILHKMMRIETFFKWLSIPFNFKKYFFIQIKPSLVCATKTSDIAFVLRRTPFYGKT